MKVLGIFVLSAAGLFMAGGLRTLWIVSNIPSRPGLVRRYGGRFTLKEKTRRFMIGSLILALLGSVLLFKSCAPNGTGLFYRCKFKKKLK